MPHATGDRVADFIVCRQPKVPLRDAPGGKQVAVVPTGTILHGLAELVDGALWLRIELAPSNPLREKRGLFTIWTCIANGQEQMLQWDGPMDADLSGTVFQVKWVPPVVEKAWAYYAIESKPDSGDWGTMWRSQTAGSDHVEEGLVSASMLWPRARRAVVRIAAYAKPRRPNTAAQDPRALARTANPLMEPGQQGSTGEGFRFESTPFTVNADIFDLRFMDKGVKHLSKLKSALADAIREADSVDSEQRVTVAAVEECLREVLAVLDVRALILRRAVEYVAPRTAITSRKRVLLGGESSIGESKAPGAFDKVLVMGLYHSCTHAIARELERRFDVEVLNVSRTSKENALWKHRVHHHALEVQGSNVLAVLMVKEPHFWIKSLSRESGNFWEIHPFREDDQGEREDVPPESIDDLFHTFEHDTIIYPNAMGLWNDAVRSYLDDDVYPPDQSVIVRCEDFLFEFHRVMDELAAMGLRDKGNKPAALNERARNSRDCRTREQALRFYGDHRNWRSNLQQEELDAIARELEDEALKMLGYRGPDPVSTWTGKPSRGAQRALAVVDSAGTGGT